MSTLSIDYSKVTICSLMPDGVGRSESGKFSVVMDASYRSALLLEFEDVRVRYVELDLSAIRKYHDTAKFMIMLNAPNEHMLLKLDPSLTIENISIIAGHLTILKNGCKTPCWSTSSAAGWVVHEDLEELNRFNTHCWPIRVEKDTLRNRISWFINKLIFKWRYSKKKKR